MSFQLPTGSSHSIELINKIERRKLARISKRILDSLPVNNITLLTSDEVQRLCALGVGSNSAEINLIVSTLSQIWQQIVYHQFKSDELKDGLSKLDFNDETVTTFLDVWQELGPSVSNRLRNVSRSGVPELLSVDWYLQLERANRFEAAKREPKVQLKLTTDQGEKYEEMNFEQLKALNYTLHEIQDKVDSLMQS